MADGMTLINSWMTPKQPELTVYQSKEDPSIRPGTYADYHCVYKGELGFSHGDGVRTGVGTKYVYEINGVVVDEYIEYYQKPVSYWESPK